MPSKDILGQFEIRQTSYCVQIFRQFGFGFMCTNGRCDIIIDVKLIAHGVNSKPRQLNLCNL